MNKLILNLALSCLLANSASAQRTRDAERELEAAVNKEVVQGDLNTAIGLYRNILARYGSDREIAAKALFQLGQCREKLGLTEARKDYERIVNEYSDQKNLSSQARSRLSSLSSGVRQLSRRGCGFNNNFKVEVIRACFHDGSLYLRNPASGAETLLVQNPNGRALSNDGKWVAYRSQGQVWLVATDGSSRRQIEGPSSKRRPSLLEFSYDSAALFVFYEENGGEMWFYPIQAGGGRKLHDSSEIRDINYPVFSPDGQLAVYPAEIGPAKTKKIFVLPLAGGEPWELKLQPDETPVGFTSDGKLVLHSRERSGSPTLWTLALGPQQAEGNPELMVRVLSTYPGEYWNGKYYYHLKSPDAGWEPWVVEGLK